MKTKARQVSGVILALALLLAACGGDESASEVTSPADGDAGAEETTSPDSPTTTETDDPEAAGEGTTACAALDESDSAEPANIELGNMQIASTFLPYVAEQQGYFEEENLTIEQTISGGGAELLPALVAGQLDIAYSNVISPILGRGQGFDFKLILPNGIMPESPPDSLPLMVKKGSGIESPEDLVGKRIAVNNLGSLLHLYISEYLEENNVPLDSVEFIETPFPSMIDGLMGDQFDVMGSVEPVRTAALNTGEIVEFDSYYSRLNPKMTLAAWVATGDWLEENGEVAMRFMRAMEKAREYVTDNPDQEAQLIHEWSELPLGLVENMRQEGREGWINVDSLERSIEIAANQGALDEEYPATEAVWECAPTEPPSGA